jgi:hypothetical protein
MMRRPLRVCLGSLLLALAATSCKPAAPTSFPDEGKVKQAQKKWCAALEAVQKEDFRHKEECVAATPTGSSAFVTRMAECYQQRAEEFGDDRPDSGAMVADCAELIMVSADPGNVSGSPVVKARCRRSLRCNQVDEETCIETFSDLDGMQRATLTSMYNLRTQHGIAGCIDELGCDDPLAENACFKEANVGRVYLP